MLRAVCSLSSYFREGELSSFLEPQSIPVVRKVETVGKVVLLSRCAPFLLPPEIDTAGRGRFVLLGPELKTEGVNILYF